MGGVNSFFFTHEWPEQRDDQMSIINPMEADMIVKFVEYLVCQGVDPMNITVLCFYNGQRKKILSSLRNSIPLNGCRFKVVTVDSYQGEENQILLLSLARHNEHGQMGFLNVENRVCVALSRAQCGLYIFGGGRMLFQAEANYPKHKLHIWQQVIGIFSARVDGIGNKKEVPKIEPSRLDTSLPLRCRNHNNVTLVKDPEDFDDLHGGCKVLCGGELPCGHACTLKCHPFPHEDVNCEVCRTIKKPTDNAPKILPGRAPSSGPKTSPSRSSESSWKTFASQEANRVKGLHDNFVPSTQRELLLDFGDSEEMCGATGGMDLLTLDGAMDGSVDGSDVSTVKVKKDGRVQVTTMHRFGKTKAGNGKGKVVEEVSLLD
jgi:helicase required for RNAi-mediated heterochromatin assembly 1